MVHLFLFELNLMVTVRPTWMRVANAWNPLALVAADGRYQAPPPLRSGARLSFLEEEERYLRFLIVQDQD
jgi:hypothetical protein